MKTVLSYLKQDSTWKGLIGLATAAGITLNPDQTAAITATGLALVGLIQVFITQDAPK